MQKKWIEYGSLGYIFLGILLLFMLQTKQDRPQTTQGNDQWEGIFQTSWKAKSSGWWFTLKTKDQDLDVWIKDKPTSKKGDKIQVKGSILDDKGQKLKVSAKQVITQNNAKTET